MEIPQNSFPQNVWVNLRKFLKTIEMNSSSSNSSRIKYMIKIKFISFLIELGNSKVFQINLFSANSPGHFAEIGFEEFLLHMYVYDKNQK